MVSKLLLLQWICPAKTGKSGEVAVCGVQYAAVLNGKGSKFRINRTRTTKFPSKIVWRSRGQGSSSGASSRIFGNSSHLSTASITRSGLGHSPGSFTYVLIRKKAKIFCQGSPTSLPIEKISSNQASARVYWGMRCRRRTKECLHQG